MFSGQSGAWISLVHSCASEVYPTPVSAILHELEKMTVVSASVITSSSNQDLLEYFEAFSEEIE